MCCGYFRSRDEVSVVSTFVQGGVVCECSMGDEADVWVVGAENGRDLKE